MTVIVVVKGDGYAGESCVGIRVARTEDFSGAEGVDKDGGTTNHGVTEAMEELEARRIVQITGTLGSRDWGKVPGESIGRFGKDSRKREQ